MLVIPSITLKNGKVIDHIKFNENFDFIYDELSENPVELCKLWRSENAKTLHITDLDGTDESPNKNIILDVLTCLDIPVTLSSTSKSLEYCELFLDKGIFRVALSQLLINDINIVKKLIEKYTSSRIIFYANVRKNYLYHWGRNSGIHFDDFLDLLKSIGASRLIYKNLEWENKNSEIDYTTLKDITNKMNLRITLNGGVFNFSHLLELKKFEQFGVDSVIISKPLYENNFPCQHIWRLAETL